MGRQEFIQDVRGALSLVHPSVETDSSRIAAGHLQSLLHEAALWFTSKTVAAYDSNEFEDLPDANRRALKEAVTNFRSCVSAVSTDAPLSKEQYLEGLRHLRAIVTALRPAVLSEWQRAVEDLLASAESWAEKHHWRCQRATKFIEEALLGQYQLPQLLIQANGTGLLLDPVARFVPGGEGIVDLHVMPSYDTVMIPRTKDGWRVHIDTGKTDDAVRRMAWSETAFIDAVEWLKTRR
ncbi:MAG: hypothetical protein HYX69_03860 [Planctomycetia bacterium]|nr:hypothetical protein [Planctomycetia bacterium]